MSADVSTDAPLRTRLTDRKEWRFFVALGRADRSLARAWWTVLGVRALAPVGLAITTGVLVGALDTGAGLAGPLLALAAVFIVAQTAGPVHVALSAALGDRAAAMLYDRLTAACVAPVGIGHLEEPELAADLQVAREFDRGMTGPPLNIAMDFIAGGLVEMVAGIASAVLLFGFRWWAPFVLAAGWASTHVLLRESGVWRDRNTQEVRAAQRDAEYAYRMAVDPPAAKELRLFGLAGWTIERFLARRRRLHELQYDATRMRERSVLFTLVVVGAANALVFWSMAQAARAGTLDIGAAAVYAQAALGTALIGFGGLNWALDGAAAPVAAVARFEEHAETAGRVTTGTEHVDPTGAHELRFDGVTFAYPAAPGHHVLDRLDLLVPAGSSLAIVGVNGAGKTTLAKLLCRLYDPGAGAIEVDGTDLRELEPHAWRRRLTAVFQDFVRFERSLRENVAPHGAPDEVIRAALQAAGAGGLAELDTPLSKAYAGGTDLSGGQWQRVALARTLCAVSLGARVVLLDEPTAQLDVRGEMAIFERVLAETRHCTTILMSHRFSTVRLADRIAVIEQGRVTELGPHDELYAAGGRYAHLFDLQASRFAQGLTASQEDEEAVLDVL